MTHEIVTSLAPDEVVRRAAVFFTTRVPATGAFIEQESARHIVLRGQGGEEIVIAAVPAAGGSAVRGSSLLFDQQVKRFFSTLPAPAATAVAS
ncbi:MAG: hypothetical protein Q8Q85_09635 [Gemmatimonadales bacterium]|nr:hypothetical protein [Gemmatimonadales bacterium]